MLRFSEGGENCTTGIRSFRVSFDGRRANCFGPFHEDYMTIARKISPEIAVTTALAAAAAKQL